MTKEITKAIILQEIQDKFKLRDFDPAKFLFDETVVPTYDIGNHAKHWVTERYRVSVSANGNKEVLGVPTDERWRVRRITLIHEAGANFDIDQFYCYQSATQLQYFFYDTTTPISSGIVKIFEFPQDVPMAIDILQALYFNVVNFVAGGYVSVHVMKEVETIR